MSIKNRLKNFYEKYPSVSMTIVYFVIAIVFTFPLVAKIGSELPQGRGDIFQAMANIDSRVDAVSTLDFEGKLGFFAENIGVHLPYVALNLIFNKYLAYNILFLLSFVLSGLGMYLLTLHFVKNKPAAFLAGLIFAFSPFHFYQSTVVNLGTMHQEWLPFFALFLFKFFEKLKLKHFIATAFFAFLIAMNEHQMLAFTAIFVAMVATYKIVADRSILRSKKFWAYVVCSGALLALVTFGMFGEMLKVATSENNFLDAGANSANKYSAKMLDPFMPPVFHAFWSDASVFLQEQFLGDSNRGSYFIGFSVLGVLGYFGFLLRKKRVAEIKESSYKNNLVFWSVSSLLFYVFALGISFSIGKFTIYLPYYLIYKFLPFYENIRTTGRIFVFAILGIAVLFAYGFSELLKRYPQKRKMLVGLFMAGILLEFWIAPMNTMTVTHSKFYDRIAQDGVQYKLIEIPGSTSYEFASYAMFTQSVHKKQVLNGMPIARKISGQFDFQQETPIIKQLLYTIPKGNDPLTKDMSDILKEFDWNQANDILNYYNVGYITLSKTYAKEKVQKLTENFVQKTIAYSERFEDEQLVAYQVKKQIPTGFYSQLVNKNEQFSDTFKGSNGALQREVGNGAQIKIVNMETLPKKVSITISAQAPTVLNFNISGAGIAEAKMHLVDDKGEKFIFEMLLAPGENIATFGVSDSAGKSILVREKKKDPKRALIVNEIVIQ